MSQEFLSQAKELWKTVSAPETVKSYKGTFSLTWQILQRLGKTFWLGLCLILVALDWVGTTGIEVGRSAKGLIQGMQQDLQNVKTEEIAAETGQKMLESSKTGVVNAITNARKQLGLAEKPTMFALLAEMATSKETAVAEDAVVAEAIVTDVAGAQAAEAPSKKA